MTETFARRANYFFVNFMIFFTAYKQEMVGNQKHPQKQKCHIDVKLISTHGIWVDRIWAKLELSEWPSHLYEVWQARESLWGKVFFNQWLKMKGSLSRAKFKMVGGPIYATCALKLRSPTTWKSNMKATGGDDDAKVRKPMNMIKAAKDNYQVSMLQDIVLYSLWL